MPQGLGGGGDGRGWLEGGGGWKWQGVLSVSGASCCIHVPPHSPAMYIAPGLLVALVLLRPHTCRRPFLPMT